MAEVGVCGNSDCKLFYKNMPRYQGLVELLDTMDRRDKRNAPIDELAKNTDIYSRFFHLDGTCSDCHKTVFGIADIEAEGEQLRAILNAGVRLRARGLLNKR